jgi:hypothetical protein
MIFQNFGFNRKVITASVTPGPNYVAGAYLIYDVGNASSYPGSGTSIYDVSGNGGPTGTLVNSPTYSSSNGGYLSFNGSNQRITYSGYFSSAFTAQIFWRQPAGNWPGSGGKQYPGLFTQLNNNGMQIGIDTGWPNSSGIFSQIWYGSGGNTSSGAFIDNNANTDIRNIWTMFTFNSNGTNSHKYYVNSTLNTTNTSTRDRTLYTPTNQTVYLAYNSENGEYQLGDMMAALVYPFQLSDAEVTQNYNIFSAR